MKQDILLASDGLLARNAGDYARRKLAFLEYYCPPAIDATAKKLRRIYIDLFAGPGLNVIRNSGEELEGGAIRALSSRGHRRKDLGFTAAHLVNLDRDDHQALERRVGKLVQSGRCMVPESAIGFHLGNANEVLPNLMGRTDPKDYIVVFADIEAPRQLPWTTIQRMKSGGHKSVDLYILFPLEMGLNRLTSYGDIPIANGEILTAFFGDESWKPALANRTTEAQGPQFKRELEALYLKKLRTMWDVAVKIMDVRLVGQQGLYRMLFATNHAAGEGIAAWARKQAQATDQLGLL